MLHQYKIGAPVSGQSPDSLCHGHRGLRSLRLRRLATVDLVHTHCERVRTLTYKIHNGKRWTPSSAACQRRCCPGQHHRKPLLSSFRNSSPQWPFFKSLFLMSTVFQERRHSIAERRIKNSLALNAVHIQETPSVAVGRPFLLQ
jgi:hypothetical protein